MPVLLPNDARRALERLRKTLAPDPFDRVVALIGLLDPATGRAKLAAIHATLSPAR